jgi:predicted RNA-binding protein with PUA-like domain
MRYWLLKSEPSAYSIDDLKRQKVGMWDGVRNYAARNNIRLMEKGDWAFFYHSSAAEIGIAGVAEVVHTAYPDPTQFQKKAAHYDPKATQERPIWYAVDVRFKRKFKTLIPLAALKNDPKLSAMLVVQKGSRLSIQEVTEKDFSYIMNMYAKDL